MTGYAVGDRREAFSLMAKIDWHAGMRDFHEALGEIKEAAWHLEAGLMLHRALRRLEKAVTVAETWRAVEQIVNRRAS